jgi:hypothetical protein
MCKCQILLLFLTISTISLNGQNVGIGTTAPGFPLNFSNALGDKISLWGNAGNHYGFGIQGGLLQIHSESSSSNIAFGYGSSNNFNERMRVINNGGDGMLLNGRINLRNGTIPLDINYGSGVWLYKADNSGQLGFMGTQNNQNIGFYGGPGGWGFTYDALNSRVGIGNNNPNAPLAFAATLGKKITFYPGGLGDAGIGMAGNRLLIYADNPNADVALGYDAAGTFVERFAVKANGALAVNGNAGNPGQVLQSNGAGSPARWVYPPSVVFFNTQGITTLGGSNLCVDVTGINGSSFTIPSASMITYSYFIPLFGISGPLASNGWLSIQILDANNNKVSAANAEFTVESLVPQNIYLTGVGDLAAGTYTISAKLSRHATGDGASESNLGGFSLCTGFEGIDQGQLIISIFPK